IRTGKGTVKLGVEAPGDVRILRGELADAEMTTADESDDEVDPFAAYQPEEDFALPTSVAYGGYVAIPATA
ncbi:MAG: carbon storage regulator, partial [Planctomycetota bacterium]